MNNGIQSVQSPGRGKRGPEFKSYDTQYYLTRVFSQNKNSLATYYTTLVTCGISMLNKSLWKPDNTVLKYACLGNTYSLLIWRRSDCRWWERLPGRIFQNLAVRTYQERKSNHFVRFFYSGTLKSLGLRLCL